MTRFRKSVALRLAVATTASAAALTALAAPSSAALSAPPGKTVSTTDSYLTATCKLVITGTDASGNAVGYVAAQSQGTLLGYGMVKSTDMSCLVLTPANSVLAGSQFAASGPSVPSSRKNLTLPAESSYNVCTNVTENLYNNGQTHSQSTCG